MATLPSSDNINFNNIDKRPKIDRALVVYILNELICEEKKKLVNITINFCSDEYLHTLNLSYLAHDTLTDIITFSYAEKKSDIDGELYISCDRTKENASLYDTTPNMELLRVIIHGALHLCGYKDKTKTQIAEMRFKEGLYLEFISHYKN